MSESDPTTNNLVYFGETGKQRTLTAKDAGELLTILQRRYKGALAGAIGELYTGVAYTAKSPAGTGQS